MLQNSSRRVQTDLLDVKKQEAVDIFVQPRQDRHGNEDIRTIYALVLGPSETPYARGTFAFRMTFNNEYPHKPPTVLALTTANGIHRFNPNIYANGTVCLSILGTWKGNPWSSIHNIESVLRSIQSLLHDKPYVNEPGFEDDGSTPESGKYNAKLAYATISTAILAPVESVLDFEYPRTARAKAKPDPEGQKSSTNPLQSMSSTTAQTSPTAGSGAQVEAGNGNASTGASANTSGTFTSTTNTGTGHGMDDGLSIRPLLEHTDPVAALFGSHLKRLMRMYICAHDAQIDRLSKLHADQEGKTFFRPRFEHSGNQLSGTFAWGKLKERIVRMRQRLDDERELYIKKGQVATSLGTAPHVSIGIIKSEIQALQARAVEDVSADHAPDNIFLWDITVMCAQGKTSASGCFPVEMVLTPQWPDELPLLRFKCKMYHPNISPDGVPFITCTPRKRLTIRWVLEKLVEIIKSDPRTDPLRHLHHEAAIDCFNRDEEGRRKYRKRAQRAAEDAMM